MAAVEGSTAVVIANGLKQGETVLDIIRGKPVGTFITRNGHDEAVVPVERMAEEGETYPETCWLHVIQDGFLSPPAREGSRALLTLTSQQVGQNIVTYCLPYLYRCIYIVLCGLCIQTTETSC